MKNLFFLFLLILFTSCEIYNQEEYRELIVIEAYAVADRPLPAIRVSTTLPADEEYNFGNAALTDAIVQVTLMNENGEEEEQFQYFSSAVSPGSYLPEDTGHTVLPERTYRLDIQFNNRDEVLRAYTTIPEAFTIQNEIPEVITYQSDEQLELVLSAFEDQQKQKIFEINAISVEPAEGKLTPFYDRIVRESDDANEIENFTSNSSGLINEANFNVNDEGLITLQFPWIGVAFFELNLVVTNNVDKNLSDFVRSQELQLGGSTLPPGEIPNARYHIEGGIGVFGSISSDTVETYFRRSF
ncbi:MAG: DUF4249 family protein [Balneolaceae bacterium]